MHHCCCAGTGQWLNGNLEQYRKISNQPRHIPLSILFHSVSSVRKLPNRRKQHEQHSSGPPTKMPNKSWKTKGLAVQSSRTQCYTDSATQCYTVLHNTQLTSLLSRRIPQITFKNWSLLAKNTAGATSTKHKQNHNTWDQLDTTVQ